MSQKKKDLLIGIIRKYMTLNGYKDFKALATVLIRNCSPWAR